MFARVLCCAFCALFVSPAGAEILVQEGDYYPELIGYEPIRITGGRIDKLIVGGFETIIEGGSFGHIYDMGDTPFLFRSGNFRLDRPIEFFGVPRAIFEGYQFFESRPRSNHRSVGGTFLDFSNGGVLMAVDSDLCDGPVCPFRIGYILHEHLLGDTNGDNVVDLTDLNNVRENFTVLVQPEMEFSLLGVSGLKCG